MANNDDNVMFIGAKPLLSYVTGVVMQFTEKGATDVIIKARGKFMSKAVDVAEVCTKRFLREQNIEINSIKTDSQEFQNKEGKKVNISTMDIVLVKK